LRFRLEVLRASWNRREKAGNLEFLAAIQALNLSAFLGMGGMWYRRANSGEIWKSFDKA
jgi:hypothetical protein